MTSTDESTADHGRTADMTDSGRERIDSASDADVERWARTLDASPQQIRDAVQAVGDRADDVELYLKGSRSTTNTERVDEEDQRSI